MEQTRNIDFENILKILGNFDYSAPPKVDIIFEESDEDITTLDLQQNAAVSTSETNLRDNTNKNEKKTTDCYVILKDIINEKQKLSGNNENCLMIGNGKTKKTNPPDHRTSTLNEDPTHENLKIKTGESNNSDLQQNATNSNSKKNLKKDNNKNEKKKQDCHEILKDIVNEELTLSENNENCLMNAHDRTKETKAPDHHTTPSNEVHSNYNLKIKTEESYDSEFRSTNNGNRICSNETLIIYGHKRKSEQVHDSEIKISKTDVTTELQQKENTSLIPNKDMCQTNAQIQQNEESTYNSVPHMVAYVSNLLKAVSKHLFFILNAYVQYSAVKRQILIDPARVQKAWEYFLRVKQHFFNLSYCTVTDIILPEIRDQNFINKLLNDTLLLAKEKNVMVTLQAHIEPLFKELVLWAMKTKSATDNRNISQTSNAASLQKSDNYLKRTSQITASNGVENRSHTDINQPCPKHGISPKQTEIVEDTNNIIFKTPQQQNPQLLRHLSLPVPAPTKSQPGAVDTINSALSVPNIDASNCISTTANVNQENSYQIQNTKQIQTSAQNINYQNSQYRLARNVERNMTIDQIINTSPIDNKSGCTPASSSAFAQDNHSKAILFSSGPQGREISITVSPTLLQSTVTISSKGSTATENANTLTLQDGSQYKQPQEINNQRFNSKQLNQKFHCNSNQHVTNNHIQQIAVNINQPQIANNCSQQVTNIYNPQTAYNLYHQQLSINNNPNKISSHNQQLTNNCYQQRTHNVYEENTRNINQQAGNNCIQQNTSSSFSLKKVNDSHLQTPNHNINSLKSPPSYYESLASFQTEFASFLKPNELQFNQSSVTQGSSRRLPLMVQPEPAPEMARSGSTDSGFISPLNFNPSTEINKDGAVYEDIMTPIITHVTSLNPQVSFIPEGQCAVCGQVTRKMCVGCYRKYYCQPECQRIDWSSHMNECQQNRSS